ncbi:MAG: autotransporter outer membrane beta-barrel domain-containing protein, partial [Pseudoxanthomonas sp.]
RQRMGVMAPAIKGHVSAWARAFSDSGTVTPDHVASNFGQGGNLAFDQTNSGQELGVDIGIADGFSVGLLLGKAQGDQTLNGTAVSGRNKIKGDTRGLYGSWFGAGGLYIDASYRTMDFDARLETGVGISHASGKADAFNIELGREWTFGDGFAIVPQLQYTRTSVKDVDTLSGVLTGFTPKGGTSSRGRLGLLASKTITSGRTTWTPYASVNAVREFDGDNGYTINNTFSGSSSTKGTSALVEGGIAMTTGKLSLFGGLNWQDGGALQSFVGGQIGLRYNW